MYNKHFCLLSYDKKLFKNHFSSIDFKYFAGNLTRRDELNKERHIFIDTFTDVFYDKKERAWFDVNIRSGKRNYEAYPSIAIPLFAECYRRLNTRMISDVLNTLQRSGILNFPYGVPIRYN